VCFSTWALGAQPFRKRTAEPGAARACGEPSLVVGIGLVTVTAGRLGGRPSTQRRRVRGRAGSLGRHAHVPPDDRIGWVSAPDRIRAITDRALPRGGFGVRPLPGLIHRRRLTVLPSCREGGAPAPLARGRLPHGAFPARGGRRWRRRPHPPNFACCPAPPPQPQRGQQPTQPPARAPPWHLRFLMRSPSDAFRLPSATTRDGARRTGAPRPAHPGGAATGCRATPNPRTSCWRGARSMRADGPLARRPAAEPANPIAATYRTTVPVQSARVRIPPARRPRTPDATSASLCRAPTPVRHPRTRPPARPSRTAWSGAPRRPPAARPARPVRPIGRRRCRHPSRQTGPQRPVPRP